MRQRSDYYLVTSSFSYFPVFDLPQQGSRPLDAARHRRSTSVATEARQRRSLARDVRAVSASMLGTFYVISTLVDAGNFIVTAKNAAGPWSDPIWLPEINGRHRPVAVLRRRWEGLRRQQRSAGSASRCTKGTARSGCRSSTSHEEAGRAARGDRKRRRGSLEEADLDRGAAHRSSTAPSILSYGAEGGDGGRAFEVVFRASPCAGHTLPGPAESDSHATTSRSAIAPIPDHVHRACATSSRRRTAIGGPCSRNASVRRQPLTTLAARRFLLPVRWGERMADTLTGTTSCRMLLRGPRLPVQPAARFRPRATLSSVTTSPPRRCSVLGRSSARREIRPDDLDVDPGSLTLERAAGGYWHANQSSFIGRGSSISTPRRRRRCGTCPGRRATSRACRLLQTDDSPVSAWRDAGRREAAVQVVERDGRARPAGVARDGCASVVPNASVYRRSWRAATKMTLLDATPLRRLDSLKTDVDGRS